MQGVWDAMMLNLAQKMPEGMLRFLEFFSCDFDLWLKTYGSYLLTCVYLVLLFILPFRLGPADPAGCWFLINCSLTGSFPADNDFVY